MRGYRTDSAFHERFTGGDAVVPSGGNLPAIAERAMRGYVNPLWRARLTFDYVVARLQPVAAAGARIAPAGAGPMQVVAAAIDERRAAPYEYALTFSAVARAAGIPARPVAGYLIDDSARAVPHYWAEFFLEDFGWVPVDPAMEAGASLAGPARGRRGGRPVVRQAGQPQDRDCQGDLRSAADRACAALPAAGGPRVADRARGRGGCDLRIPDGAGWGSPSRTASEPRCRRVRRRPESNRCIKVLQTSPLPLGYGAGLRATA